jgi:hypothetical protein
MVDSVNAINDLRAVVGTSPNAIVLVNCFKTPGDLGGGTFYWDPTDTTTPDNVGLVVVPTLTPRTGCWKRIATGPWSVRWFGARGDRTTDDSAAFSRAIAAMDATAYLQPVDLPAAAGLVLLVPAGEYIIGDVVIDRQISLQGETSRGSAASTVLLVKDGSNGLIVQDFTGQPATVADGAGAVISNLAIRGSSIASKDGIQIFAHGVTVRDVHIENIGGTGITIDSTRSSVGPTVVGNANTWRVEACSIFTCGLGKPTDPAQGSGLYVNGANAQAGICIGSEFLDHYWWGVWDVSDLGNTYIACTFEGNGHDYDSTIGRFMAGGAARVGDVNALKGLGNTSTFISCYVEHDEGCDFSTGNVTVVAGLMAGATGVGDQPVQRIGASRSRLFFRDENARGLFEVGIPEANYGSGEALFFRYQQLADVGTQPATWALRRFKPGNDSLSEISEAGFPTGRSPYLDSDALFDRCWGFQWVDSGDPTMVPFGWTDAHHPRGAGLTFFRKPILNQQSHFTTQSPLQQLAPNSTAIVTLGAVSWLTPEANANIVAHFSLEFDVSSPTSLADGKVHVGAYQIDNNQCCTVSVVNDGATQVNVRVNATFEQYKSWSSASQF